LIFGLIDKDASPPNFRLLRRDMIKNKKKLWQQRIFGGFSNSSPIFAPLRSTKTVALWLGLRFATGLRLSVFRYTRLVALKNENMKRKNNYN